MDRFSFDGSGKKLIYQEALEFMGEVRAGISMERFNIGAVRCADSFIDMLNETEEARSFLSLKGVSLEYAHGHIRNILSRMHFNRENDHYLTLCLPRSASESQINRRWKDLMLIYHPDRSGDADAASCAKRINEAYNVLKHPDKKREYDMRMTSTAVAHFGSRRRKVVRSGGVQRYPFISPGMRRLFPKLIIPFCVAVSSVILLVIFLDNRPISSLPWIAGTHEQGKPEGRKVEVAATKESGAPFEVQETGTPREYREFYRAEHISQDFHTDAIKRNVAGDIGARVVQGPPSREMREGDDKKTVASTLPDKDPLRVTGPPHSAGSAAAGTAVSNPMPEKVASDRQLQKSTSSAGIESQAPAPGADDSALDARYGDLETEVFLFLVRYIQAYEEGDIAKFMGFFSHSVVENGSTRYEDMRQSYKKSFETGRYSYTLKNVGIKTRDSAVFATADYTLKRMTGESGGQPVNGKINWTLGRENGDLKIIRMDYDSR